MNSFLINIICGVSILIPALLIFIRRRRISGEYYPFAILLWVGAFNELFSLALIMTGHSNLTSANIYVLLEFIIVVFQFSIWNHWSSRTKYIVIAGTVIIWALDNVVLHTIDNNNSLYRMIYAIAVVCLSMGVLSRTLLTVHKSPGKHPAILICFAFIIYYALKAYGESFNVFNANASMHFYYNLWILLSVIGLFSNIIYTLSILCIPRKIPFTLPY